MQKLFSQEILDKLIISNNQMTKTTRNYLFFFALILMAIALSRPVINEKEHTIQQEITPIIVAIDVSKSMLANDIYPTRLAFAKHKLLKIIDKSQHNAVGVLLFAKSAFILSPITQDFSSLKYLVKNFDNGLNFDNGSNIHALIEASNKLFRNYQNKNLLILTDGANGNNFQKEINYANNNNINIYTLTTATNKPTPIKIKDNFLTDSEGNIVTVALNENIKELSLQTQGGYIHYSLDDSDINAILSDIEGKSAKDALNNQKYKTYTELFYYPLALAILILLIAFSSFPKRKMALSLLIICFIHEDVNASIFDFSTINKANEAYAKKDYQTSSKEFEKVSQSKEGHYNLANSLYKEKKYEKALSEYKKVITSDKTLEYKKLHNMGNTYVKLNKLNDAQKMYEKALKIKEDTFTKENLEMVKKAIKQKKNNQNKNKKNSEDKDKKNKNNQNKKKENNKDQHNKKAKDENKKSKDDKKKKQEEKENKNASKDEKSNNNKQKNKSKQTSKDAFNQQKSDQELKKNEMSDLEEKKWLDQIKNRQTPVLLRRVETKDAKESDASTPW